MACAVPSCYHAERLYAQLLLEQSQERERRQLESVLKNLQIIPEQPKKIAAGEAADAVLANKDLVGHILAFTQLRPPRSPRSLRGDLDHPSMVRAQPPAVTGGLNLLKTCSGLYRHLWKHVACIPHVLTRFPHGIYYETKAMNAHMSHMDMYMSHWTNGFMDFEITFYHSQALVGPAEGPIRGPADAKTLGWAWLSYSGRYPAADGGMDPGYGYPEFMRSGGSEALGNNWQMNLHRFPETFSMLVLVDGEGVEEAWELEEFDTNETVDMRTAMKRNFDASTIDYRREKEEERIIDRGLLEVIEDVACRFEQMQKIAWDHWFRENY